MTDDASRALYISQNAVGLAEGYLDTEDEQDIIDAWQHLHDTGLAYRLQGWFGRTAQSLIEQGVISG